MKASSFLSIILVFLAFTGENPAISTPSSALPRFSNVIEMPVETDKTETETMDSKVPVEIFTDFTCEKCVFFAKETLPAFKEKYDQDPQVEIRVYLMPDLSDESQVQAVMATKCAADQNQFWEMHQKISQWDTGLEEFPYELAAEELKLDKPLFLECMSTAKHRGTIEGDIFYATQKKIDAKPTVVINRFQLVSAPPLENIEWILKKFLIFKL